MCQDSMVSEITRKDKNRSEKDGILHFRLKKCVKKYNIRWKKCIVLFELRNVTSNRI